MIIGYVLKASTFVRGCMRDSSSRVVATRIGSGGGWAANSCSGRYLGNLNIGLCTHIFLSGPRRPDVSYTTAVTNNITNKQ